MTELTVLAEEGPIRIRFDDLVRYHGHGALAMLAITFRAQELAFAELCVEQPARSSISVRSGHPGPGVRDAFEMVTRCVTRNAYVIDPRIDGPRLNPNTAVIYAFEISIGGVGSCHIALRPGVLPDAFFAHQNAPSDQADPVAFALLRREIAEAVLATPRAEELFERR